MTLLELPMILLYMHMTSSFHAHDIVTERGNLVFLYLKYIKSNVPRDPTIKFLMRDYKLIFP